jgi:tetratricopeptide (TPR) repeat protein
MAVTILTIIFFAAGAFAILYGVAAGLNTLKFMRLQKSLPEKLKSTGTQPITTGPPAAEAHCERARLLLKRARFDAALADCKRAIDLNPNHAVAHTLWEQALEKEIPPELVTREVPEEVLPVLKKKRVLKKRTKIIKERPGKIKARKKAAFEPVPEKEPTDIDFTEKELVLEEISAKAPPEEVKEEPVVAEKAQPKKVAKRKKKVAKRKPVAAKEAPPEIPPVPEKEVAAEESPPVEVPIPDEKILAEEPFPEEPPVPEKEVAAEEPPPVEVPIPDEKIRAEEPFPAEQPVSEKEIAVEKVEEPPVPEKEVAVDEPPDEEVPVLKDREPSEIPAGESPLEEIDHEKLREFEEGEATAADAEWTRYADKDAPELPDSKIDMNQLPEEATGLKETLVDLKQAEAYNLQGETNISKNQFTNAIKDFSRAININPKFIDALINRGSAYAQLGRFNDALSDFNQALKYEKKDAELFSKRGEIFLQNNLYDQAIKDFSSAIVLNPMYSDAYLNRGRAYSEKGMPDEAMNDFNHAIKADSDHADYPFVDRAAPAIQEDQASLASRDEAEKLNQQGIENMEKELYDEALKNFTQAIDLQTSFADAYIYRGRIYTLQKNTSKALADFNQAVMFDPLNADIYYWRAQAWKIKEDIYNTSEDLKLACEMGHEAACQEYKKLKPASKK